MDNLVEHYALEIHIFAQQVYHMRHTLMHSVSFYSIFYPIFSVQE